MRVAVLNFSHMDPSWLGTQEECLSQGSKIIALALDEAERDSSYRFSIEHIFFLEYYVLSHPEDLPRLRRLAQNGQIELDSVWLGLHSGHQPGETFVRNILYAKRYVREVLGVEPIGCTMSDLPGHSPQLPQMLAKSGVHLVQMTRMGPRNHRLFWWQSPDGTQLLTWAVNPWWNEGGGYGWSLYRGITESVERMRELGFESDILNDLPNCKADIYLVQAGNDLVVPFPHLQQRLREWNTQSSLELTLMSMEEYYQAVKDTPGLPVLSGEVPCSWAYISAFYADHYLLDQEATFALLSAERLASLAQAVDGVPYPAQALRRAWIGLIIAGDHNWDNQGARIGDRRKMEERKYALQVAEDVTRAAIAPLAERVQTRPHSVALVVFNPSSWPRCDAVAAHFTMYWRNLVRRWDILPDEATVTDPGDPNDNPLMGVPRGGFNYAAQGFQIMDDKGEPVPYQIVEDVSRETRDVALVFPVDVPSLGYRTFYLHPVKEPPYFPATITVHHNDLPLSQDWVIQNRWFTVTLGAGTFTIEDRQRRRVVVRNATFSVRSHPPTADFSRVEQGAQAWGCRFGHIGVVEAGGVRTVVRVGVQSEHPAVRELTMDMTLYEHLPRLDLTVTLEAQGNDLSSIHLAFPTGFTNPKVMYAIPYGANALDNVMPNTGPLDEYGFPRMDQESWRVTRLVQGWLDIGDDAAGLTIASNGRLFRIEGHEVHCVLQRITPRALRLVYRFRLTPHDGDWIATRAPQAAEELLMPLTAYVSNDNVSPKILPAIASFLTVEPSNVAIATLKQAEDGQGCILRLVETNGQDCTAQVTARMPFAQVRRCDLTERDLGPADLRALQMGPFEIVTLRLL